jgi:hypothetical protein
MAKLRAPDCIHRLSETPIALVVAFDHCNGDTSKHSFWVMRRRAKDRFGLFSPKSVGGGRTFRVSEKGHMLQRNAPERTIILVEYAIPADASHELVFKETDDGRKICITLSSGDLLTDEQSRQLLERQTR